MTWRFLKKEVEPVEYRNRELGTNVKKMAVARDGKNLYYLEFVKVNHPEGFARAFRRGEHVVKVHIHTDTPEEAAWVLRHIYRHIENWRSVGISGIYGDTPNQVLIDYCRNRLGKKHEVRVIRPPRYAQIQTTIKYLRRFMLGKGKKNIAARKFLLKPVHRFILRI